MPISDSNGLHERVKQADTDCADFHQKRGDRIVSNLEEDWRPDGVCVSVPLGFRDTGTVAREVIATLGALDDLFQRNARLCRVLEGDVYLGKDSDKRPRTATVLSIRELDESMTADAMCRATNFWKYIGQKDSKHLWERMEPSPKLVTRVASLQQYPQTPVLRGIIQSPSLRPDGSVIDEPGYDLTTGYYFKPNAVFRKVPNLPTPEEVKRAVKYLAEPFAQHEGFDSFPFVSQADRWLPIAMAMTLLARPAIDGCVPFFGYDATEAGTGKGLVTDVASIIATGEVAAKSTFPTCNSEELEKVLSSQALAGSALICFDNVSAPVRGDALDKVATTPIVEFRILGKSEIRKLLWQSVIAFTGNQLAFHGDTARRALRSRQESQTELPSMRGNFKYSDLLAWVKKNRVGLVNSALTLMRAYAVAPEADRKASVEAIKGFGSFVSWAELVAASIHWATGVNILECRIQLENADPTREAESDLLKSILALQEIRNTAHLSSKEILEAAYLEETVTYSPPTRAPVFPELREAVDLLIYSHARDMKGRPSCLAIAKMLQKRKGIIRCGVKLESFKDSLTNTVVWQVSKLI